jgi:heme oxygenase
MMTRIPTINTLLPSISDHLGINPVAETKDLPIHPLKNRLFFNLLTGWRKASIREGNNMMSNVEPVQMVRTSLSQTLKDRTHQIHTQTENSHFIQRLFSGRAEQVEYAIYLQSLYSIYSALETALKTHAHHPDLRYLYDTRLFRTESIQKDLVHWQRNPDKDLLPQAVQVATAKYVHRIQSLSQDTPSLLASHSYVRYMGDMSGGQILKKRLASMFQVEQGLEFYDFSDMEIAKAKVEFRQGLDQIGRNNPLRNEDFILEAIKAFELNGELFVALDEIFK